MRVLSLGEILWDVFGEKEFLGGAPLNFSVCAQRLEHSIGLLTAVGTDERGERATAAMRQLGLATDLVQRVTGRSTGTAIVTTDPAGNASFVIERPTAFDFVDLNDALLSMIQEWYPEWIYFGTLAQTIEQGEQRLKRLLVANPEARCFYDINLRDGHWNLALVQRLSRLASIIKLNEAEAETLFRLAHGGEVFSLELFCTFWSSTYGAPEICVTLGSKGCAVWRDGSLQTFSGFAATVVDTVGAGDAFAAAFLHGNEMGWSIERTSRFANALGAIVAGRAGATPTWTIDECLRLIELPREDEQLSIDPISNSSMKLPKETL